MNNKSDIKRSTPGSRHYSGTAGGALPSRPPRTLLAGPTRKVSGRGSAGKITIRHRGGAHKRMLRQIDWKRDKRGMSARVERIEYDPNRSANIALLLYPDGGRRYILAPLGLTAKNPVQAGPDAPIALGNALPLSQIPAGTIVHNLEIKPGKGAQLVRSAGAGAGVQSKEGDWVIIKMPSGEIRRFVSSCYATIGQVGNEAHRGRKLGKAGRRRWLGWRPAVRGVAQNPKTHPHGGGEGRSGIGMKSPKSPWGKRTLGKKTRKKVKYSNRFIIKDRRVK